MLQEKFQVKIESTGLGLRYVAKGWSRAKELYATEVEEAQEFYTAKDAKQFARTWAERKHCRFSVWVGTKRIYSVIPT